MARSALEYAHGSSQEVSMPSFGWMKVVSNVQLAIMIRDMVYLDGGDITWHAKLNDGKTVTGLDSGRPKYLKSILK